MVFKVRVCFVVQRISGFQSTHMFPCSESQWFPEYTYVSLFRESVIFKVQVCFVVQRISGFQSTGMFCCSENQWFSKYRYVLLFRESVVFKVHVCFLAQRVSGFSRYTYLSTTMVPPYAPHPSPHSHHTHLPNRPLHFSCSFTLHCFALSHLQSPVQESTTAPDALGLKRFGAASFFFIFFFSFLFFFFSS